MLELRSEKFSRSPSLGPSAQRSDSLIAIGIKFILKHFKLIALFGIAGLIAGTVYQFTAKPVFTASSLLLIDDSKVDLFQRPSLISDPLTDSAFVESQIEVLKSGNVARQVVRMLDLENKPTPKEIGIGAWLDSHGISVDKFRSFVTGLFQSADASQKSLAPLDKEGLIAMGVSNALTVRRVGTTYAVSVTAVGDTPKEAFELANAVPEAYIAVEKSAVQSNAKRTIAWLDDRLTELRQKSADADLAVESFKRDRGTSNDRGLVSSQLRQLESMSLSYRNLYDNLQTRYLQALQEESFTSTKARVISPAILPTGKSSPKSALSLTIGLMIGLIGGGMIALVRDALYRGVASASELESATGVECLGVLEAISPAHGQQKLLQKLLGRRREVENARATVFFPFNRFAQEMRRIAITLRQRRAKPDQATVVGVVSLDPREGKSTVSVNLAQTLGLSGCSTLLVDLDLRNPSLTRALNPPSTAPSIFDAGERLKSIWRDTVGMIDFMPGSKRQDLVNDLRVFQSKDLERNFQLIRQQYEFIVVDLPPILAVADADAVKHLIDAFVIVAKAGSTEASMLNETLNRFDPQRTQVVGAVLNMATPQDKSSYYNYTTPQAA